MHYSEDCKFLSKVNGACVCNAGKAIAFGCDSDCCNFVLRNNVDTLKHRPVEVLERIKKDRTKYEHDKNIKELLEFTNFTGFLLTRVIKELKDVSLKQFKKSTGGSDFLTVERTEYSSSSSKKSRLDLVIEYDDLGHLKLCIDTEPQDTKKTYSDKTEESYSLVARAIYYGALLLATSLQPGESYHNLRKVYSVWICYKRPIADMREPILRYNFNPEKEYRYCRKDAFGEDSIYSCRRKFDDGDILSVILISVPDIEAVIERGFVDTVDNYDYETLYDLYNLLSPKVSAGTRKEFYKVTQIDDGGENSVNVLERLRTEIAEKDEENAKLYKEMVKKDEAIAKLRLALQKSLDS